MAIQIVLRQNAAIQLRDVETRARPLGARDTREHDDAERRTQSAPRWPPHWSPTIIKSCSTSFAPSSLRTGEAGRNGGRVATRFPPEPNGYLHIGHAKSICLNFGVAREFGGTCNLRFDDTNPTKEDVEYVDSIKEDVRWLGFEWTALHFASDYFEQLYSYAVHLIREGKAYVDSQTARRDPPQPRHADRAGHRQPVPRRAADENLDLFARMRAGEFADGAHVLRAKIDMASPNINMRDPVLYRIRHAHHHRTGDAWCIYPMYDFAHPPSDALEHITHSLCTLEFEDHRPLYDWLIDNLPVPSKPRQIEFARLNLTYTVMSKRKLLELVQERHVSGWDDPRMPTIVGMRRRGYTPEAIRDVLRSHRRRQAREHRRRRAARARRARGPEPARAARDGRAPSAAGGDRELSRRAGRRARRRQQPGGRGAGTRKVPFSRELYIERDDFREDPPKKFFRLAPGREVRLRCALLRHLHGRGEGRAPARSPSCAAPTIRRRAAATRRTAAR